MYKIKKYSLDKAKKLGVEIKPSSRPGKKIDVYKKGVKISSIGAIDYGDYPTYLELEKAGIIKKGAADERRRLYKLRHAKDRAVKNTPGYFADQLLW